MSRPEFIEISLCMRFPSSGELKLVSESGGLKATLYNLKEQV